MPLQVWKRSTWTILSSSDFFSQSSISRGARIPSERLKTKLRGAVLRFRSLRTSQKGSKGFVGAHFRRLLQGTLLHRIELVVVVNW